MPIPEQPGSRQPANPTAAHVVSLTDFDQVKSSFLNWHGRIEQLSSGRFNGALRVVRGSVVRLMAIEGNQQVSLQGRDAADMFSIYPVVTGNADSLWQGRRLQPGQFVLVGSNVEVNHQSARTTRNLGISLRTMDLEDATRTLLGMEVAGIPHAWAALSPSPEAFATLNCKLSSLLNHGLADPTVLETPEGHRLEQECIQSLVASIFLMSASGAKLSAPGRSLLVRRAEEFMRARLDHPVGAIDLCRELGVSDRTLRLAFHERFGFGPMVFYKNLRLNAVRAKLKNSPQSAVAEVAREFGFHHLGNFAFDYRRLFGERPSQTDRSAENRQEPPF